MIQTARPSRIQLTTTWKRPYVSHVIGALIKRKIGPMSMFTMPKMMASKTTVPTEGAEARRSGSVVKSGNECDHQP